MRTEKIRLGLVFNLNTKPRRDIFLATAEGIWKEGNVGRRFFLASPATKAENLVQFASAGLDGLIVCGVRKETLLEFFRLMPNHPPTVVCSYMPYAPEERQLLEPGGLVLLDNAAIGRLAADYLLSHELRNFAFLGANNFSERTSAQIRSQAFADRLREVRGDDMTFTLRMAGQCDENEDYWDATPRYDEWIRKVPLPCGVFTNDDRLAFVLINLCKCLGIDVPGEMEVLGVNNSLGFCESVNPSLTSVYPDHKRSAAEALKMVLALIRDPNLPAAAREVWVSDAKLVERGSTDANRNYGQIVARTRDYIRRHACEGISVDDVVKELGGSRSTLEKRIHKATGAGILAMIQRVRLEHVCHLLTSSDLSITQITLESGYGLSANLSKLFKREFGMSMRDYRIRNRPPR